MAIAASSRVRATAGCRIEPAKTVRSADELPLQGSRGRAANSFFTRMYYVARSTKSPMRVAEWRGEAWCVNRWQAHVRPDGFARLEGPDGSVELLLELDLGSEIRSRLEEKMERYRALARAATAPDVVVFCFPSEAREVSARQVLYGTPMPVATATLDRHLADPFGAIWLPLRDDRAAGCSSRCSACSRSSSGRLSSSP
jgi:hypothetical protein